MADTPPSRVDEMLGGRQALVFAGGHTHLPMVRQHRGMLLVNPGSLGLPFREYAAGGPPVVLPRAEYAVVDIRPEGVRAEVRRVALERGTLASQLDGWDNPLAAPLRAAYA